MADLITPIIIAIFGGAMLIVIFGFYLLSRMGRKPAFEEEDYYKRERKRRQKVPNSPDDDFYRPKSRGNEISRPWGVWTKAIVALVIMSLLAALIAAIYGFPEGLLLFLVLPIIIRFIRSRKDTRQQTPTDGT